MIHWNVEETGSTQSSWSCHRVHNTRRASSSVCSDTQNSNSSNRFKCPWSIISYSKGRARIITAVMAFWGDQRFERTSCLQHDFYESWMFITRLHKIPLLLPILSETSYSISLRRMKILSSHRRRGLRSGLFHSYFVIKIVYESLIIPTHSTYSA
jgi:hypothetical protein